MPIPAASVDMSNQNLLHIPDELYANNNLNWLILSNNSLRAIPPKIHELRELTRLALNDNKINRIDKNIGHLRNLTWIDLTRNRLEDLPEDIENLKQLTGLGLSENRFAEIPKCIYNLIGLKKFGFFANRLEIISPSIRNLINLVKIDLSNNLLVSLPEEFCELRNLTWLNLSNNKIKTLPNKLNRLFALEELGLGCNEIEELPLLTGLRNLRILPVFKNRIKKLGRLNTLDNLEKLDLSDNLVNEFPNEVIYLKNLKYLNLKSNHLHEINFDSVYPIVVSSITMIDVSCNKLTHLPLKFFKTFSNLTTIKLINNPFRIQKPVLPKVAPNLLNLCYSKIMNLQGVVENIWKEKGTLLFKESFYVCDNCMQLSVVEPYTGFNLSSIGDGSTFIVKKTLCSLSCYKKEFNSKGALMSENELQLS
ncbi:hypothetical protein COBT_001004 [Conglomerata obtusa]